MIMEGRKFEMAFEYTPTRPEPATHESFWRFSLPTMDVQIPFLLVGSVSEPSVYIDRPHVNFRALLVQRRAQETVNLVNDEDTPFAFSIDPPLILASASDLAFTPSLSNTTQAQKPLLKIQPAQGVIPPHSRLPLQLTFRPTAEREYNHTLNVFVKQKSTRIPLNIKGEGYAVRALVTLIEETPQPQSLVTSGGRPYTSDAAQAAASMNFDLASSSSLSSSSLTPFTTTLSSATAGAKQQRTLSAQETSLVEFGAVHIHERRVKQVCLLNSGQYSFDFVWSLPANKHITITPMKGVVKRGERQMCELVFTCTHESDEVSELLAVCTLAGGVQKYALQISGHGHRPALALSFTKHDFGPCFVMSASSSVSSSLTSLPLPTTTTATTTSAQLGESHVWTSRLRERDRENGLAVVHTLEIVNQERRANIAIECLWERKPHLDVSVPATVLAPGQLVFRFSLFF
jgi:hydrocephalus-inducing protein